MVKGSGFAGRLREERERLGLKQAELASLAGISRNAQITYERGRSMPSVGYLERLKEIGIDVAYLLTGRRALDPTLAALEGAAREREAVMRVLEVQRRLGVELDGRQLATLVRYVERHCPTPEALEEFARLALEVAGVRRVAEPPAIYKSDDDRSEEDDQ